MKACRSMPTTTRGELRCRAALIDALQRLKKIARIIDRATIRCNRTGYEITDAELKQIYKLAMNLRPTNSEEGR